MMHRISAYTWAILLTMALGSSAIAVTWDDESQPPPPGDPNYAAGMEAFKREEWDEVITRMTRVVKRRPWHDEAYNRMGFAFRKLGNFQKALAHYYKALELNPYHRGALEYLGETYLEMGCALKARETLARLEAVCRRVVRNDAKNGWKPQCEEWGDLNQATQVHRKPLRQTCDLSQ